MKLYVQGDGGDGTVFSYVVRAHRWVTPAIDVKIVVEENGQPYSDEAMACFVRHRGAIESLCKSVMFVGFIFASAKRTLTGVAGFGWLVSPYPFDEIPFWTGENDAEVRSPA